MIRRLAACVAIVLAALAVLAGTAPAHADDELGLSTDGSHWSSTLSAPLFPAAMSWIPGDVEASSFYVRNQGPTDGVMSIDAFTTDTDRLIASGTITVSARIGSGPWTSLAPGQTRVQPAILKVARNATSRVTVKVTFAASATAQMDSAASFRLRVRMSQGDVKGINTGHGNGNGNGSGLPNTGSPITTTWIWFAAALIGSGIALVLPRRRREADHG